MKKSNLLSTLFLILFSFAGLTSHAQNTVLSGKLKGLSGGTVKIFYNKDGVSTTDTVKATGDNFTWKINLSEPIRIALTTNHNNYYFFAQPGHIRLTGIKDSTRTYRLSGSPMQQDAEIFDLFIKDLTDRWNLFDKMYKNAPAADKAMIQKKRDNLKKEHYNKIKLFIAHHPKSFFSLYLITLYNDYNEIKPLYNELDESAKKTIQGKKIARLLAILGKSRIGMQMADFTQADTNGKQVNFNSFRGKYVLVDFWASWCMPCRAENPNVLKAYNAFRNKGFTVIGISLDDKAVNWKKAIRDDKMPWTQLSELNGWKNALSISLGIQAIPSNFLIDPSGKIIAKDLRGEMLENKLKELLN